VTIAELYLAPVGTAEWGPNQCLNDPAVRWKRRLRQTGAAEGSAYIGPGVPHPTEVAAAAAFFGSPRASYVSGQHIGINGGMAMLEPNMRMRRASPGQL
jgi:NAD(P)-dependent dehydrogenase (short-subunit alcohol dehydrogenase family)